MEELIKKLKSQIIEALNLEDVEPEDLDADEPLFGEGLGLDSIDSLELIVLLEKEYGLRIENPKEGREIFHSIKTIAEYIEKNQKA